MLTLKDIEIELTKHCSRLQNTPPVVREDRAGGVVRFVVKYETVTIEFDLTPQDPLLEDGEVIINYEAATKVWIDKHHHDARGFMLYIAKLLSIGFLVDRMTRWFKATTIAEIL